jgi:hypothetical protein
MRTMGINGTKGFHGRSTNVCEEIYAPLRYSRSGGTTVVRLTCVFIIILSIFASKKRTFLRERIVFAQGRTLEMCIFKSIVVTLHLKPERPFAVQAYAYACRFSISSSVSNTKSRASRRAGTTHWIIVFDYRAKVAMVAKKFTFLVTEPRAVAWKQKLKSIRPWWFFSSHLSWLLE